MSRTESAITRQVVQQKSIEQMIAAASAAQQAGRRAEALRLFKEVIARGTDHPIALNVLGLECLGQGDLAASADYFARAVAADPRSPELRMNLAKALREAGDDSGEEQALAGVLSLDQTHFMALVRMAELHERRGEMRRAAERWSGVLALSAALPQRSPALEMMLEHAREVVARQHDSFAAVVDAGLAQQRDTLSPQARRRFDACIDHALGRRQIYANQCHGLHFPFLPAEEFFDRDHFPWMDDLEAQTAAIRAELEAVLAEDTAPVRPYIAMEPGTPTNKWSPLDGSLTWGAMHLWKDGRRDDAVCARFPHTAAVVEALPLSDMPGRTPTVFFSLLKPGAHLPAHTGVSNVRTIIHLPLIVPDGCTFRVGGDTRAWEEGKAWAFDDTIDHEAWNRSDRMRAVLIFDVWNPYLSAEEQALLRTFYTVADATQGAPVAAIRVSD